MNQPRQISIEQTKEVKCNCGNETFNQVFFIREIPALLSGTLRPERTAIPGFQCTLCGKIIEMVQKKDSKNP